MTLCRLYKRSHIRAVQIRKCMTHSRVVRLFSELQSTSTETDILLL